MLCQFSFHNFRSYKSETTFDFQAATLPEFKDTLITQDKASDLLPVAVVYGPNGGGKSNLLEALACLIRLLQDRSMSWEKIASSISFSRKQKQFHFYMIMNQRLVLLNSEFILE